MNNISAEAFKDAINTEGTNPDVDLINVCTPEEYKHGYIEGVRNVPLDELSSHIEEFKDKNRIYIHCMSGARGKKAAETLASLGVEAELINVDGGLMAWEEAGFETIANSK